ncbi:protein tyrosine and serine/threonine kinase [Pycnococcus provasolii]
MVESSATQVAGRPVVLTRATTQGIAASSFRSNTAKQQAYESVCNHLREVGKLTDELEEAIKVHIRTLPTRYSQDINTDSEDILQHYKLLQDARVEPGSLKVAARAVQIVARQLDGGVSGSPNSESPSCDILNQSFGKSIERGGLVGTGPDSVAGSLGTRPAFGSSPSLERLARESAGKQDSYGSFRRLSDAQQHVQDRSEHMTDASQNAVIELFEVTVASTDQPKLLSRITTVMGNLGLNIREAHVFSAKDGYTLDVFVIDSWAGGPPESLAETLRNLFVDELMVTDNIDENMANTAAAAAARKQDGRKKEASFQLPRESFDGVPVDNDWELDPSKLTFESKVASGSFGDMYRGHYNSQEVAIKILRNATDDPKRLREFMQEVAIMRKVRHKSVVQFIGACTKPPNLCIVFVYMHGGSVYDFMHRQNGSFSVQRLLRVAMDIASGMDYLHRCSIIHRDMKSANLLMDEHGDVKIADFGVARVIDPHGVMTAETGTYRWMAPEVIEHSPYTPKCDVYSYGITIWELLTRSIPYADQTPLQAAVGVVQKGLRPPIPPHTPQSLRQIMELTWRRNPDERPTFSELREMLQRAVFEEDAREQMRASSSMAGGAAAGGAGGGAAPSNTGGFFARLRGGK